MPPPQSYYVTSTPNPISALSSSKTKSALVIASTPVVDEASGWDDDPAPISPPSHSTPAKPTSRNTRTPAVVPASEDWGESQDPVGSPTSRTSSAPNLATMSKEEKDKEMARRREERKAVSATFFLYMYDTDVPAEDRRDERAEEG